MSLEFTDAERKTAKEILEKHPELLESPEGTGTLGHYLNHFMTTRPEVWSILTGLPYPKGGIRYVTDALAAMQRAHKEWARGILSGTECIALLLRACQPESIPSPVRLARLAQDAIQVQDACNGIAVAKSYGTMMVQLREALAELGEANDTEAMRSHPINRMWASKIHDLAGLGMSDPDRYAEAYARCREWANAT